MSRYVLTWKCPGCAGKKYPTVRNAPWRNVMYILGSQEMHQGGVGNFKLEGSSHLLRYHILLRIA